MRILFIESGNLWPHTLPKGCHTNGHDVMISGPITEKNLPKILSEFCPDIVMTIGWGQEHTKDKQSIIREEFKNRSIPLIYWAVEDPAYIDTWSLPFIEAIQPDFVFSICENSVKRYSERGIPTAYLDFGFEETVHIRTPIFPEYSVKIAVVANAYPEILKQYPEHFRHEAIRLLIKPLLEKQIRIDFWGNQWEQMGSYFGKEIPKDWIHGYLSYSEANKVFSSADIVLGLQNYPDLVTQRTYEILGSEGFLLTLNTPGVCNRFKPGSDLIVSSSQEETLQKVHYYLEHDEDRRAIQKQGASSVQIHSYRARAKQTIEVLIEQKIVDPRKAAPNANPQFLYFQDVDIDGYVMHTVKTGDTLWKISQIYGITIMELNELNSLTNNIIYENQILKIKRKK